MSLYTRPYQPEDADRIAHRQAQPTGVREAWLSHAQENGCTLCENGDPIAAWGLQVHWDGVASVWSVFSPYALQFYPLALAKNVKRHLEDHIEKLELHRVQAFIVDSDEVSKHWIAWLGFEPEGRLRRYLKDHDVWIYARVKEP